MNEPKDVDPRALRARLLRSIAAGLALFAVLAGGFAWIENGPTRDGAPAVLRAAFRMNESVWRRLQSGARPSAAKAAPPAGQEPRVNGDIGLEAPADLAHYAVDVESGGLRLSLPLAQLAALPRISYSTDFKCIEGWSDVTKFSGTRFSEFMKAYGVGLKPDGTPYKYVGLETPDRAYYVSIDMKSMLHPQTLLAFEENDKPLSMENGAPMRLVIPIKYGIKSLKRVGRIFFSDERPRDYWAERGYDWYSGL